MKQNSLFINLSLIVFTIALIGSGVLIYHNSNHNKSATQNTKVQIEASHDYQIVSRAPLKIWPSGTVFPQGMLAYFYAGMPNVAVKPKININGIDHGDISGTIKSEVMLRAVNDKAEAYWSFQLSQTPEEAYQLDEKQTIYSGRQIDLDPSAAYTLASQIAEEILFQSSQFQLVVVTNITLVGTINNTPVEKSVQQELPLTLQATSFTLGKTEDIKSKLSIQQNTIQPSMQETLYAIIVENYILIVIFILSLITIIMLLSMKSKTQTRLMMDHRKYRDWITEGSVELTNQYLIQIHSLQGLVDLAIDLDKRVIYDSATTKYYVLAEDLIYLFDGRRKYTINDNKQQLGKLLLKQGLIKPEQLEMGLYYQNKIGYRLGESLIALGFIDETTLFSTLAGQSKFDYYEAYDAITLSKLEVIDKQNINKAKALMAVPLGKRADGVMVVACSEFSREGMIEELQKVFGRDIHMVGTCPSFIDKSFEAIQIKENQNSKKEEGNGFIQQRKEGGFILPKKDLDTFITSYYRGTLNVPILLQALGKLDQEILQQIPNNEELLPWLVSKHIITGEYSNLIKGLEKAILSMEWKERQEKLCPDLVKLLLHANYITEESKEWIMREVGVQKLELEQLLIDNFMASHHTIEQANEIINRLNNIVKST